MQRCFLERLIKRALKEGRIQREERLPSSLCKTSHHVECVAFTDARVKHARRKAIDHLRDARAIWHRRSARNDLRVARHHVAENLAKRAGETAPALLEFNATALAYEFGRAAACLPATHVIAFIVELVSEHREGTRRMECRCITFRKAVSLALDRLHMEHHRAIEMPRFVEHINQRRQIVTIDWSNRYETEVFEPRVFADTCLRDIAELVIDLGHRAATRHALRKLFRSLLELAIGLRETKSIEVRSDRALRFRDRHAIVIEHHKKLSLQRACVVEAFHRNAVDDGRITNEAHDASTVRIAFVKRFAIEVIAARHANSRGNRGACVANAKEVVGTFAWLRKSCHAVALAKLREQRIATREQFVRIALVPNIEEQAIVREVEDAVHRDREFNNTEVWCKMSA